MKHVLVVDQDSVNLIAVKEALEHNYVVSLLDSGTKVIEFIANNSPDIVLLSAYIPDTMTVENYENIQKVFKEKKIPLIYLTDYNDMELEQTCIKKGADDFIAKPFAPETLRNRVKVYLELFDYRASRSLEEKFQDAISVSFAELVEFRDVTTGGHLKNTTLYFRILLEEIIQQEPYKNIIPIEEVRDLLRSAPLHDIGKIGINDDILRKASPLDYNEYEYMKTHTTLGKQAFEKIIQETGGTRWLHLAKDIAYCHHERWDGTGYPNGLKGEEIPLYARILTIADVYDALTSIRTYKEAYSHQKAMSIITEGKGSLFDPNLVEILIKANKRFEQALLEKNKS